MSKPLNVLIVEDSNADAQLLLRELRQGGFEPVYERVDTREAMTAALDKQSWDIILADYVMPQFSGLAALELLKEKGIDLPFIVISGKIGEDTAVEAMKAGANDYILKGNLMRLVPAIERELGDAIVRRERKQGEAERDRLMNQLREVNAQLVLTSIQASEQVEEVQRVAAELDAVFMSTAEAIVVYDPAGKILRLNPVAVKMLGSSPADQNLPLAERISLVSIETEQGRPVSPEETPVSRALRGETVRGIVLSMRRSGDKQRFWFSVSAAPIRTAEGKTFGAVAVFTDVTATQESRAEGDKPKEIH